LITAASRIAKSEDAIDLKTSPETTPASSDATEPAEHQGVVGILVELAFSIASFAAGARSTDRLRFGREVRNLAIST
jgi:hypothetical protein